MILSFNSLVFINPTSLLSSLPISFPRDCTSSHGLFVCFKLFEFMLACPHGHYIFHLFYSNIFLVIKRVDMFLSIFVLLVYFLDAKQIL